MKEIWFVDVEKQCDAPSISYPLIRIDVAQEGCFVEKYAHSPDDNSVKLIAKEVPSKLATIDQLSPPNGAAVDFNAPDLTR